MNALIIFYLTVLAIAAGWFLSKWFKKNRRKKLLNSTFPEEFEKILIKKHKIYMKLPTELKEKLKSHILIFLHEKNFEGAGGLEITEEIRVTIAAEASMLLLGREHDHYPGLHSIIIYPDTFFTTHSDGLLHTENVSTLGQAWNSGSVILAWNNVKSSSANYSDGHNVTLHEFAHQLDQQSGEFNGTPVLKSLGCYSLWGREFEKSYMKLLNKVEKSRKTVLDEYGATNEAEFFAVATETFFEKPEQLRQTHTGLYEQLSSFYGLDPRKWIS